MHTLSYKGVGNETDSNQSWLCIRQANTHSSANLCTSLPPLIFLHHRLGNHNSHIAKQDFPNFSKPTQPVLLCPADAADFFEKEEAQPPPGVASPKSKPPTPRAGAAIVTLPPEQNEEQIQKALYVGNFSAALDACFEVHPSLQSTAPNMNVV